VDINPRRGPTVLTDLTRTWPFRDDSIDLIFSSFVLEHLPDPFHFIKECSRCLRPGGRLIILVPFIYQIHASPQDYLRFTDTFLKHCLNNTPGLCVQRVHPLGIGPVTNTVSLGLSLIPTAFLRTVLLCSTLLIDTVGLKFAALAKSSDVPDNLRRVYALGWVAEALKQVEPLKQA
jgi:SAM-dependent methyltransferase